jgi:hypothetical protein
MDFEELRQKLKDAGVLVVRVEGSVSDEDVEGFTASGSIEDYIEALKALRARVVYVLTESLEEDDFRYQLADSESGSDGELQEDGEGLDLCTIEPALQSFRSRIGQMGAYRLCAQMPSHQLNFFIWEAWYEEFLDRMNEAAQSVDEQRDAVDADIDAQEKSKARKLLESLNELIHDSTFVRLPTQKAMLAYALEHITGLEDLDRHMVKEAIQDVRAKMYAKGLLRRRT